MATFSIETPSIPVTPATRWRYRYSILTTAVAVLLISWGGLVTSIDAGLAVPDWPTSFGSYDPFQTGFEDPTDPSARWWHRLPVLAEHGHRLLGALVGFLIIGLALWTWRADPRSWMRKLGFVALGLVIFQGILGGLRVIWVSLDLAVVHALVAQIFFALLVAMTLFTAKGWLQSPSSPPISPALDRLKRLSTATVVVLYIQIILGALLRHPGFGVDLVFSSIHIVGAIAVVVLVLLTFSQVRQHFGDYSLLNRSAWLMLGIVTVQILLGFSAFTILLLDTNLAQRSVLQVVLNSSHLVVGALLMAATVSLWLLSFRKSASAPLAEPPADSKAMSQPMHAVGS